MLTPTEVQKCAQTILKEAGNSERCYEVTVDSTTSNKHMVVSLEYIISIKYDTETDPQISKDPEVTCDGDFFVISVDAPKYEVVRKVIELIERIEDKELWYE